MKILFKYTTRSRRSNFLRGYDSIVNNVNSDNYHILISIDKDDSTMFPLPELKGNHTIIVGNSKNKIDAINRDVNEFTTLCDWDIIVNMSDDMIFTVKGFDDIIRDAFWELDLCLHFPDQNQGQNCMTMSILGREYYNRDKFIYHPEFESLWVDIVAQEEAQIRGCYKFVNQNIFIHLHPSFGQAHYDAQYQKTEEWGVRQRDYATYLFLKQVYDKENRFPIRSI
jgi:hypothetical protein